MPYDKFIGGTLYAKASLCEFMPFNNKSIQLELITETGIVVISKSIQLHSESKGLMVPFKIDVIYDVQKSIPVRLILRQEDDQIPGNVFGCSQLLTISP